MLALVMGTARLGASASETVTTSAQDTFVPEGSVRKAWVKEASTLTWIATSGTGDPASYPSKAIHLITHSEFPDQVNIIDHIDSFELCGRPAWRVAYHMMIDEYRYKNYHVVYTGWNHIAYMLEYSWPAEQGDAGAPARSLWDSLCQLTTRKQITYSPPAGWRPASFPRLPSPFSSHHVSPFRPTNFGWSDAAHEQFLTLSIKPYDNGMSNYYPYYLIESFKKSQGPGSSLTIDSVVKQTICGSQPAWLLTFDIRPASLHMEYVTTDWNGFGYILAYVRRSFNPPMSSVLEARKRLCVLANDRSGTGAGFSAPADWYRSRSPSGR